MVQLQQHLACCALRFKGAGCRLWGLYTSALGSVSSASMCTVRATRGSKLFFEFYI